MLFIRAGRPRIEDPLSGLAREAQVALKLDSTKLSARLVSGAISTPSQRPVEPWRAQSSITATLRNFMSLDASGSALNEFPSISSKWCKKVTTAHRQET